MSKKKKIVVLSCMVALLAVTAVCNFLLTGKRTSKTDDAVTTANYFSQYRTERLSSRNEQILQLDGILAESEAGSETHTNALNQKLKLAENMEKELMLESLIRANGFDEVAVTIGLFSDNINVIVRDADLTEDDSRIIYLLLEDEIGATPEFVKIISIS